MKNAEAPPPGCFAVALRKLNGTRVHVERTHAGGRELVKERCGEGSTSGAGVEGVQWVRRSPAFLARPVVGDVECCFGLGPRDEHAASGLECETPKGGLSEDQLKGRALFASRENRVDVSLEGLGELVEEHEGRLSLRCVENDEPRFGVS